MEYRNLLRDGLSAADAQKHDQLVNQVNQVHTDIYTVGVKSRRIRSFSARILPLATYSMEKWHIFRIYLNNFVV